ncbi:MAG: MBL fold metallo-hydrolase [Planctomycetota bacterium]|jgi:phosphoribosyl 1,2-cyclic phosphodiesterase
MLIRCWGSRGSIPVSGAQYVRYGGDTSCLEIRTASGELIIVDSGSGIRELGNALLREKRHNYSFLLTHAHWDHILGFPFFKPIYRKDTHLTIYGCPFTHGSIYELLEETMKAPYFPVSYDAVLAEMEYVETCHETFTIGGVAITPINLSHPNQGLGFKFEEEGKVFVYLTDNELTHDHPGGMSFQDYRDFATGADLLIHDAEYYQKEYDSLTRTWGHSVYTDALQLALDAGVARFGLFHHNAARSDDEVDAMVEDCRALVGKSQSALECFAVGTGWELTL